MKFNKKMMAVYLLASFLATETAMARISAGDRKPVAGDSSTSGGSSKGQPPSSFKVSQAAKDNYQVVQGNTSTCSSDQGSEKYFPLELFNEISRDDGAGIDIEVRTGNKITVRVPPTINVCGQFMPEFRQDKVTKNVTVFMKLFGTRKEVIKAEDGSETIKETKDVLLSHKELEDCLTDKKIMVDGKIDFDKVPANGYSESVTNFDYDFDKKADAKKKVTVSYGYAKSFNDPRTGYIPKFGFDDESTVPGEVCMRAEKVAESPVYINKGKDVLIEEINLACKSGDIQKIAAARASIGNYDALRDIADKIRQELDAGYLIAVKVDVQELNKKMKKIEEQFNKEQDTMDEDAARKLAEKYAGYANELSLKFLDPAIMRLDSLLQKRAKLDDEDPQLKGLDDEIRKLNEDIGQFAMRSTKDKTSQAGLYAVMEKYALNESAKSIEDIRYKSYLFGKVYAGKADKRGQPMTFEAANQKQADQMVKFERTLTDWSDVYLVGKGNLYPIKKVEKERQGAIERMNSRMAAFEKKDYSDYVSYCSVGMLGSQKNPVKCKEWSEGRNKRISTELKKREKDLGYIRGRNEKLEKMGTNYNEHQRKLASREEADADNYESYGASYTSYEDNFADRFPGYYGPSTSTAYNPANYNMGGVSNSMQMGQQQQQFMGQQQMMGQQQFPQLQMGGGQPQSGWPGI